MDVSVHIKTAPKIESNRSLPGTMKWAVFALVVAVCVGGAMSATCDSLPQQACTKEYAPVCATFIKTFPTECVLENKKCELAKQGFEFQNARNGDCCFRPMTMELSYRCGTDGKVYGNEGSMRHAGCETRDYIKEQSHENCPDFPEDWFVPAP
ncbi:four-domain proteases inhibitor [Aplysia californica]|uniref:Four-domain proteases inhibitor n=1 Tax=Aplysia californica TaxID=6500 RepID=A0ABM0JWS6_APLCA|nr:four-domain proteases inhibitor [Aplysia californica]